jgi:hypothetical protein
MFTFLRKIRKSLIEPGSARKYLVYAIGEILLVMIGILLALQVNDWNEERKNRILEKYYLERIVEDLQADIDEMNKVVDRGYGQVSSAIQILSKMNVDVGEYINILGKGPNGFAKAALKRFPLDPTSFNNPNAPFGRHQHRLWAGQEVDLTIATYDELLNNGKLDVIKNLEIRQQIIYHYTNNLNMVDIQIHVTEARNNHRSFLLSHKIPTQHNMSFEEFMGALGDKKDYEVILKNYIWGVSFGLNLYRDTALFKTQELIGIIDEYLEKI